jgi:hypothetical protein
MTVEFKPSYYEWDVFVDGEIFYTFGDFIEEIPYPLTKDNLTTFCESMVSAMEIDLTNRNCNDYEPFIPILLLEEMKKEIWYRYS